MTAEPDPDRDRIPWQQRALDNLWLLLVLSVVIPAAMYLAWGLWELIELPSWS